MGVGDRGAGGGGQGGGSCKKRDGKFMGNRKLPQPLPLHESF